MWIQFPSLLGEVPFPISHLQTGCANHQNEAQAWEERAKSSLEINWVSTGTLDFSLIHPYANQECFVSNSPLEERPKDLLGKGAHGVRHTLSPFSSLTKPAFLSAQWQFHQEGGEQLHPDKPTVLLLLHARARWKLRSAEHIVKHHCSHGDGQHDFPLLSHKDGRAQIAI